MTRDDKEIVSAVCAALAGKVGTERFEVWFRAGTILRWSNGALVVAAPDAFTLETLRRQCGREIVAALGEVLGDAPPVKYEVDASLAADAAGPNAAAATDGAATLAFPNAQTAESSADIAQSANVFARKTFWTLDTFVVGDGNRIAHSAALSVIKRLGEYSPLFIHGPTGSGKSHLLQGIWCEARQKSRMLRVLYLTAEQFTTQFIEALKGSGLPSFRRKIRDTQLLLIDDVQFFAGKQSTLVELQHSIDTLLRDGRQLVFAADRPAMDLRLGPELAARLSGGLTCKVETADYSTRLGVLMQLAERQGLDVSSDVLTWLASQLDGDARQLAGALNRLEATSRALDEPITPAFAQSALADLLRGNRRAVRLPDIVGAVCDVFGLEPATLHSGSKSPGVTHPRMLAMFLARKYTRAALSEIGQYFGRRSHSTVFSAESKVQEWLTNGKTLAISHGECSVADALRRVEAQLRLG